VLGANRASDWVLNALKSGKATLRLGKWMYETSARMASPEEEGAVRSLYVKRYGGMIYQRWYSGAAACIRLTPMGPPRERGITRGELNAVTTFQEWSSRGEDYLSKVSEAFDSASEEYDFTIGHNYINTWIRRRSIEEVLRFAGPEDSLVEIGCGTGAEALELSRHVRFILATDVSEEMIKLVRKKVKAKRLEGRVVPYRVRASNIDSVRPILAGREPKLAYSFNGALNCEPDLPRFVSGISDLLPVGGHFVCSIRNTLCVWEAASVAGLLKYGKVISRKKRPIMVSVGGHDIPATYYSPREFERFFSPAFVPVRRVGLPSIMPPAYMNAYFLKLGPLASLLREAEGRMAGHFPLNSLGDQTLFVFRKVE
jgi:SAM-dependent methyltransferase